MICAKFEKVEILMKKHTKVSLLYKTGLELEFMKKDDALVLFKIIHALGFTLLVYMTPLS